MTPRTFSAEQLVRFSAAKATVTELSITEFTSIAVWGVHPGQEVPAHTHPDGQDTWVMVRGELTYYLGGGQRRTIRAGDPARVASRRGELTARVHVTATVRPGQVYLPMHDAATNRLTFPAFDPHSRQPSYKHCAVSVEPTARDNRFLP